MQNILGEDRRFCYIDWGRRDYAGAVAEMMAFVERRIAGHDKDTIFFVEHEPVITMGRRAREEHLVGASGANEKSVAGIPVVPTDRGGDVTLHAPGQLVIYPVIKLKMREQRLHDLLAAYEEVLLGTARTFGIDAFRVMGKTGAWTGRGKLASIGIHLRRWITYHGMALNVSNDLSLFDAIIPCGLHGIKMTSLEAEAGHRIDMEDVKREVLNQFPAVWMAFSQGG
jgi:lipoate-protein ligase B